jgi:hypothetical protein
MSMGFLSPITTTLYGKKKLKKNRTGGTSPVMFQMTKLSMSK